MAAPAREAGSPAEFAPDPAGVAGVQRLCQLSTLLQVVAREDEDDAGPPRDAAGLVIPESICKAILVELLEALVPVHAHRKRHRYVRPWTVAITAAGRVELGGGKGFEDSRLSANSSAESMQSFVDGAHDRWYWTPERLMGSEKDGAEVDIWAVGAIFSEMLLGSPIFYGFDPANQLFTMFKTLGFPSRAQLSYLGNGYDQLVLPAKTMPATLRDKLPCLGDDAHDLLVRLLDWCPNSRISASAALQHPYLAPRAMPQREARASIVQFLINKASDLSGISQEISRFSDDADHHDDDHHHDAAAAGAGFSRGRHDNMHSSGNLRSSDRQAHPETEELSAACNVYSKLDAPLSLDLPLSSSGAGQGRTCPKPSRKPLAVLALSKGTVVPDSPQEGQGSAWTPKSYGGAERGDAACGAVRSTAAPQALYLSQRRSSDVVETARGHGTPLCHGALCGDENCGGNAQKEAEEQLLSPAVIRKSGLIQLRVPHWEQIVEDALGPVSRDSTRSPIESPVSLASVSCYGSCDDSPDAKRHGVTESTDPRPGASLLQPQAPADLGRVVECWAAVNAQVIRTQMKQELEQHPQPVQHREQQHTPQEDVAHQCVHTSTALAMLCNSEPAEGAGNSAADETPHTCNTCNSAEATGTERNKHVLHVLHVLHGTEGNKHHTGAGSEGISSGDKWGAFEDGLHNKLLCEQSADTTASACRSLSVDATQTSDKDQSRQDSAQERERERERWRQVSGAVVSWSADTNASYSSLQDEAHIKTTAKISLQEIKKLLRGKWALVRREMDTSMHALRDAVTRCKCDTRTRGLAAKLMMSEGLQGMLEHGSNVASVCSGSLGDAVLVALVREEMQVIHRECKDTLEESKRVHGEYRHLKVSMAETEASVKYMMQHCSNECSFAITPESGTEAELERHELMLAAVLRGKARFGRHRRNLQARLAQQNQAVEMLENAMSAVEARVALLAPGAAGVASTHGKPERLGQTEERTTNATATHVCLAAHGSASLTSTRTLVAGVGRGMQAASGVRNVAEMDRQQQVSWRQDAKHTELKAPPGQARADASALKSGPPHAGPIHQPGQEVRVRHCQPSPARPASSSPGQSKRGVDGAKEGEGSKNTRTIASIRRLSEGGDGSWYYSEHSVYSEHTGAEEDALLQLVQACDDAERLLLAHHDAGIMGGRHPSAFCPSAHSLVHSGEVHGQAVTLRTANKHGPRDNGGERSRERQERRQERACLQNGTGKGAAGGRKAGGRPSQHIAETRVLKSIQNLVASLGKTVSSVEKQQRATSAQLAQLIRTKPKAPAPHSSTAGKRVVR